MKENDTPAGEERLIRALAAGATVREAARRAGMGERTAYRRLAEADFRRAVSEARGGLFDSAVGRMADLAAKAVETLERQMESDQPSVALGAAKAVLGLGPRLRESAELEERINLMEEEADVKTEGNETAGDEELVLAFAAGASVLGAAQRAGVEEATARGRLADADFRRAVSRARGRMVGTVLGRLAGLAGSAAGVLERLMDNDEPSVARRAAKAVLELGPRLREPELQERIRRLEVQADQEVDANPTPVAADSPWEEEGR